MSAGVASTSFPALGTSALVAVTDRRKLPIAEMLLADEVALIDATCSRFRADSELARANAQSGSRVPISALLAKLVRIALRAAEATNGVVDPTLGSQMRAAGYDRTFELVRKRGSWTVGRVEPPTANWRDVELDDEQRTLLIPKGVELDLGATAKGWAADHAAHRIAAQTGDAVLVALGGDIAVDGPATSNRRWPVRIADDHNAPLDGEVSRCRDNCWRTCHLRHRRPPLGDRSRRGSSSSRPPNRAPCDHAVANGECRSADMS